MTAFNKSVVGNDYFFVLQHRSFVFVIPSTATILSFQAPRRFCHSERSEESIRALKERFLTTKNVVRNDSLQQKVWLGMTVFNRRRGSE